MHCTVLHDYGLVYNFTSLRAVQEAVHDDDSKRTESLGKSETQKNYPAWLIIGLSKAVVA